MSKTIEIDFSEEHGNWKVYEELLPLFTLMQAKKLASVTMTEANTEALCTYKGFCIMNEDDSITLKLKKKTKKELNESTNKEVS